MISFENDYSEGAHEEILRRLAEVNKEGITGYGNDSYCESAKEKIRLLPPLTITESELEQGLEILIKVLTVS